MKFNLDTKVRISATYGKTVKEYFKTLGQLGFTQNHLDTLTEDEIEKMIKDKFIGWVVEYIEYE